VCPECKKPWTKYCHGCDPKAKFCDQCYLDYHNGPPMVDHSESTVPRCSTCTKPATLVCSNCKPGEGGYACCLEHKSRKHTMAQGRSHTWKTVPAFASHTNGVVLASPTVHLGSAVVPAQQLALPSAPRSQDAFRATTSASSLSEAAPAHATSPTAPGARPRGSDLPSEKRVDSASMSKSSSAPQACAVRAPLICLVPRLASGTARGIAFQSPPDVSHPGTSPRDCLLQWDDFFTIRPVELLRKCMDELSLLLHW
jgi:hypothetical protein